MGFYIMKCMQLIEEPLGTNRMAGHSNQSVLTDEEVRRFKRDGYLIKRGLLDPVLCATCRDLMWSLNDVPRIRRDDPATYIGRFTKEEENPDAGNLRTGFNWRSRSLGKEQPFLDLLPHNPKVLRDC